MRRVLIIALSVVLAGCTSTVSGRPSESGPSVSAPSGSAPAGPALVVTCAAVAAGSSIAPDRDVLTRRAQALSASASIVIDGDRATITLPGSPVSVSGLCGSESLAFRGLVAPAVPVACTGTQCSADPLGALSVVIPTDDRAFAALGAGRQQDILAALGQFDCASAATAPDDPADTFVACDRSSGPPLVYLLGPEIVASDHISGARALEPNPAEGRAGWAVSLSLDSTGATAWHRYTSAHNTGGTGTVASATDCGPATVACADFVAFVLGGSVLSVPITEAPLSGETQISGSFTGAQARRLATGLSAGALPVPLEVASVVRR